MASSVEPVSPVGPTTGSPATPSPPGSDGGRDQLAGEVRRLIAATVTSAAPPDVLAAATAALSSVASELERHVPDSDGTPRGRYGEHSVRPDGAPNLARTMPFDVVIGSCNPMALPVVIEFEPPKAIGHATFTAPYEGAPGCVHGAVLAGAFDIILTAANVLAGAAGPTVSLSIRYLKPTVIDRPALFEGWVTSVEGRRTHSRGTLTQAGVVTVEAEGVFVTMERSRIASMHRRGGGGGQAVGDASEQDGQGEPL